MNIKLAAFTVSKKSINTLYGLNDEICLKGALGWIGEVMNICFGGMTVSVLYLYLTALCVGLQCVVVHFLVRLTYCLGMTKAHKSGFS